MRFCNFILQLKKYLFFLLSIDGTSGGDLADGLVVDKPPVAGVFVALVAYVVLGRAELGDSAEVVKAEPRLLLLCNWHHSPLCLSSTGPNYPRKPFRTRAF